MQMADTDDVSYFLRYLVVHNSTIRTQITNDDTRYTNLHLMNIYLHTSKYSFRDAETSAKRNAIHIYIYIYIVFPFNGWRYVYRLLYNSPRFFEFSTLQQLYFSTKLYVVNIK